MDTHARPDRRLLLLLSHILPHNEQAGPVTLRRHRPEQAELNARAGGRGPDQRASLGGGRYFVCCVQLFCVEAWPDLELFL